MLASIMLYAGSIIIAAWGVAHIVPTKSVVAGFGPLSPDNRRVITMEWVSEGLMLCFIGVLTGLVTVATPHGTPAATLVYRVSAVMLLVMAVWTLVTGGRTAVVFFKICPAVKTAVAVMFFVGTVL
ncbi:MAG: hypothetical protein ACYSVY_27565 [Planctomycetota bacterium]|jgi:hypothetical protein